MVKSKKHDCGYIERREIVKGPLGIAFAKFFLLVSDIGTQKIIATYGPFDTIQQVTEFANLHSIEVEI